MTLQVHAYAAGRRPRRKPRRTAQPVTVITVNRLLWQHALDLAAGDGSRIRIISATEVIVANHGRQS